MVFDIRIHKHAKKKFERVKDQELKARLKEAFSLLSEPFNLDTVKIQGERGTFRTRIGKYRILFVIEGKTVYIVDFDTRGKIYK